jgi:hypothetical protein
MRLSTVAASVLTKCLNKDELLSSALYSGESFRARFTSRLWMRRVLAAIQQAGVIELGCGVMRLPIFKAFAWQIFFGRRSFPDVDLKPARQHRLLNQEGGLEPQN